MNFVLNLLSDNSGGLGPPVSTTPDDSTNIGLGIAILCTILGVVALIVFIGYIIHFAKKSKNDTTQTNAIKTAMQKSDETDLNLVLSSNEYEIISVYRKLGEQFGEQAQKDFTAIGKNMLQESEKNKND